VLEVFEDLTEDLGFRLLNQVKVGLEVALVAFLLVPHKEPKCNLNVPGCVISFFAKPSVRLGLDHGINRDAREVLVIFLFLLRWLCLYPGTVIHLHVLQDLDIELHGVLVR
jgi:hypothetical protein